MPFLEIYTKNVLDRNSMGRRRTYTYVLIFSIVSFRIYPLFFSKPFNKLLWYFIIIFRIRPLKFCLLKLQNYLVEVKEKKSFLIFYLLGVFFFTISDLDLEKYSTPFLRNNNLAGGEKAL